MFDGFELVDGSLVVSLSLRLKDLQGPVTRVKKKRKSLVVLTILTTGDCHWSQQLRSESVPRRACI